MKKKEYPPIKRRIRQYIKYRRLSYQTILEQTGIKESVFKQYHEISGENLRRFTEVYDELSLDWVVHEQGEMLKTENEKLFAVSAAEFFKLQKQLFEQANQKIEIQSEKIDNKDK